MKNKFFDLSIRGIAFSIIGAGIYAALDYVASFIPVQTNGIRFTVVALVCIANTFGPGAAFISGMLGNMIIDAVTKSIWIQWAVASGAIGIVAGIPYILKYEEIEDNRFKPNFVLIALFGALAGASGPIVGMIADLIIGQATSQIVLYELLSAATNAIWGVLGAAVFCLHSKIKSRKRSRKRCNVYYIGY